MQTHTKGKQPTSGNVFHSGNLFYSAHFDALGLVAKSAVKILVLLGLNELSFQLCNFLVRFPANILRHLVFCLSYLKLNKTFVAKNTFYKKYQKTLINCCSCNQSFLVSTVEPCYLKLLTEMKNSLRCQGFEIADSKLLKKYILGK